VTDRDLSDYPATVTFAPGMRSGRPTIGGTRLPLSTVLEALWHGGVEYTREGWGPTREQCLVAAWYGGIYGVDDWSMSSGRLRPTPWRKRFGAWAREHHGSLWEGKFDKVPDSPSEAA
jgi:hypothetical protein